MTTTDIARALGVTLAAGLMLLFAWSLARIAAMADDAAGDDGCGL